MLWLQLSSIDFTVSAALGNLVWCLTMVIGPSCIEKTDIAIQTMHVLYHPVAVAVEHSLPAAAPLSTALLSFAPFAGRGNQVWCAAGPDHGGWPTRHGKDGYSSADHACAVPQLPWAAHTAHHALQPGSE